MLNDEKSETGKKICILWYVNFTLLYHVFMDSWLQAGKKPDRTFKSFHIHCTTAVDIQEVIKIVEYV
jgi:hypothetical protein